MVLSVLFYSAVALETLSLSASIPNAFTIPKVVAVLCGGALLAPFLVVARRKVLAILIGQFIVLAVCTAVSLNPQISLWGGDWRRMGLITWADVLFQFPRGLCLSGK